MKLRDTIAPLAAAILLGSLLAACQKSEEEAPAAKTATADAEHGKQIFITLCATCHGRRRHWRQGSR